MKIIHVDMAKLTKDFFGIKKYDKILHTDFLINARDVDLLSSSKIINVVSILKKRKKSKKHKIITYIFYKFYIPPIAAVKTEILVGENSYNLDGKKNVLLIVIGAGGSGGNGGVGGKGGSILHTESEIIYGGGGGGASGGSGGHPADHDIYYIETPVPGTIIEYKTGTNNGNFNDRKTTVNILINGTLDRVITAKGGLDGTDGASGGDAEPSARGSAANSFAGNGGFGAKPLIRYASSKGNDAINIDGQISFMGKGGRGAAVGCVLVNFNNGGGGGGGGAGGERGTAFELTNIPYPSGALNFKYESGEPGEGGNGGKGGKSSYCAFIVPQGTIGENGENGKNAISIYEDRYGFGGCGGGGGGGGGGNANILETATRASGGNPGLGSRGGNGCIIIVYTN